MSELSDAQCDRIIAAITWECEATLVDRWLRKKLEAALLPLRERWGWPPPSPGTHSSNSPDDYRNCPCIATDFTPPNGQTIHEHNEEYVTAARWSSGT